MIVLVNYFHSNASELEQFSKSDPRYGASVIPRSVPPCANRRHLIGQYLNLHEFPSRPSSTLPAASSTFRPPQSTVFNHPDPSTPTSHHPPSCLATVPPAVPPHALPRAPPSSPSPLFPNSSVLLLPRRLLPSRLRRPVVAAASLARWLAPLREFSFACIGVGIRNFRNVWGCSGCRG